MTLGFHIIINKFAIGDWTAQYWLYPLCDIQIGASLTRSRSLASHATTLNCKWIVNLFAAAAAERRARLFVFLHILIGIPFVHFILSIFCLWWKDSAASAHTQTRCRFTHYLAKSISDSSHPSVVDGCCLSSPGSQDIAFWMRNSHRFSICCFCVVARCAQRTLSAFFLFRFSSNAVIVPL